MKRLWQDAQVQNKRRKKVKEAIGLPRFMQTVAVFTVSEVTALWWGRGARYYIMLIIIIIEW